MGGACSRPTGMHLSLWLEGRVRRGAGGIRDEDGNLWSGQIMEGFEDHNKNFGLYPKGNGEPSRVRSK